MLFGAVFACLESRISRVLGFKAQVVGSLLQQKRMERFPRSRSSIPYDCASPQCANSVGTVVGITRDGLVHIKFVVLVSFMLITSELSINGCKKEVLRRAKSVNASGKETALKNRANQATNHVQVFAIIRFAVKHLPKVKRPSAFVRDVPSFQPPQFQHGKLGQHIVKPHVIDLVWMK